MKKIWFLSQEILIKSKGIAFEIKKLNGMVREKRSELEERNLSRS
jgi:hypothetical protein